MLTVENTVEIRYAGVVVGRSSAVRDLDAAGAFIVFGEPLPVGTRLSIKIGDSLREARIEQVLESADANAAGIRVRFVDDSAAPTAVAEEASAAAADQAGAAEVGSGPVDAPGGNGQADAANRGGDDGGQGQSSGRRRRRRR
jgi:hypothetical protein